MAILFLCAWAMANDILSIKSRLFGKPGQRVMQRQGFQYHGCNARVALYNSRTSSMLWTRVFTSARSNGLLMKSFAPALSARSL